MRRFQCPYLQAAVELSDERSAHIAAQHPEIAIDHASRIEHTLADPDEVRKDIRFPSTRLISRWFDDLLDGKILVVAVVQDEPLPEQPGESRWWIVTAYATRRLSQGVIEWTRP